MEAEPRRWLTMYTTHVKQKRKVYHDGALLLYPTSGRLILDGAGNTLVWRLLRASEEVSAGAALTFPAYLVDVGEPEACPAAYHDDAVRLVQAGPHLKKILLLDEEGEVIDIRHLKPGESIERGKKCNFPNYLVDIGKAKNEKKALCQLLHIPWSGR